MKRSAKNYLCIVGLAAALSFAAACVVKAHELQAFADESGQKVSESIQGWHMGAALSGTGAGLLAAWLVLSRANEKSEQEILHNNANKAILTAASVAGLAIGYAGSCGVFGSLGKMDLPSVQTVKAPDPVDEPKEEQPIQQEAKITADSYPVLEDLQKEKEKQEARNGAGILQISDTQNLADTYASTESGKSAILVQKGADVTLSGIVTKSGNAKDPAKASAEGSNAAIFVQKEGNLQTSGGSVQTDGAGAPGITAQGGTVYLDSTIVSTNQSDSEAFFAADGGQITGSGVQANTQTANSPVLMTGAEGTITMDACAFATYGDNSPLVSGLGSFVLTNCGAALQYAPGAVLQNNGSLHFDYSSLSTMVKDAIFQMRNPKSDSKDSQEKKDKDQDKNQDQSKDKNQKEAESSKGADLSITGSKIALTDDGSGASASFLSADNAKGSMLLAGNIITLPSGKLAVLNQSQIQLTLDGQTIEGRIYLDQDSKISIEMKNEAVLSTAINTDNTGGEVNLHMAAGGMLYLLSDCYVTSFIDDDPSYSNIQLNGYNIYVNGNPMF